MTKECKGTPAGESSARWEGIIVGVGCAHMSTEGYLVIMETLDWIGVGMVLGPVADIRILLRACLF